MLVSIYLTFGLRYFPEVPIGVYESFFKREFAQISIERYQIKQIIYDPIEEVILQWIP
nr:element excision factor XisH family protein [Sphaerospermopsis sp. FACHB-1094]